MPFAAWIWVREGWRRPAVAVVAFAAGLVAQVAWLYEVATGGLNVLLIPDRGLEGVTGWVIGFTGLAALFWSLGTGLRDGPGGMRDPDRVLSGAFGLFGTGVLLQQIARALA